MVTIAADGAYDASLGDGEYRGTEGRKVKVGVVRRHR
jgi:hypothetical protein